MLFRSLSFGLVFAALAASVASANPTPIPGGANQIKAVSATLGQTVFNGDLRITITDFREATDAEVTAFAPANKDDKLLTFSSLLRNGTNSDFTYLVEYSLADKDDVSLRSSTVNPGNLHILPAAAARQRVFFEVSKDFVPVKLIVECGGCSDRDPFRNIRFTIPQH